MRVKPPNLRYKSRGSLALYKACRQPYKVINVNNLGLKKQTLHLCLLHRRQRNAHSEFPMK